MAEMRRYPRPVFMPHDVINLGGDPFGDLCGAPDVVGLYCCVRNYDHAGPHGIKCGGEVMCRVAGYPVVTGASWVEWPNECEVLS